MVEAEVMTTSAALAKIRSSASVTELRSATAEAIAALSIEAQLSDRVTAIKLKLNEKEVVA